MSISGTVPHFSLGPMNPSEGVTVVTVTGAADDARATGTYSTEGLERFYRRCLVAFGGISGTQLVSGVTSGVDGVGITSGQLSGLRNLQREIAMRAADITHSYEANGPRLTKAQANLTLSGGEVVFGA